MQNCRYCAIISKIYLTRDYSSQRIFKGPGKSEETRITNSRLPIFACYLNHNFLFQILSKCVPTIVLAIVVSGFCVEKFKMTERKISQEGWASISMALCT